MNTRAATHFNRKEILWEARFEQWGDGFYRAALFPPEAVEFDALDSVLSAVRAAFVLHRREAVESVQILEEARRYFSGPARRVARIEMRRVGMQADVETWRITLLDNDSASMAELTVACSKDTARSDEAKLALLSASGDDAKPDVPAKSVTGKASDQPRAIADRRRDQIIQGAFEVISSKGFEKASIREIAGAAGMPIPTMYQYISSKDELLPLIFERVSRELTEELSARLTQSGNASNALKKSVEEYFNYCGKNRRAINLIYRETRSLLANERKKVFLIDRSVVKIWSKIIARGQDEKSFASGDPDLIAEFVYFLCTAWAIRFWSLQRFGAKSVLDELLSFVSRAVGISPSNRLTRKS